MVTLWPQITIRCLLVHVIDAADISEVCVINRYVICDRCKVLIPDVDNLDEHVCETTTAAVDVEMIVKSSFNGYQCDYCHKTFSQVTCCN